MPWAGGLKLPFLQLANDLRDSVRINDLHARLRKIDDMHHKVDDIHTILFKLNRSGRRLVEDSLFRQEMPLKPEIFHGRDDLVEGIAQLLLQEKTSRVCILGPGGMGKTSVSLAVAELPLIKERFPDGKVVWVPCIEATSATLLLEILYIQLQIPGDKEVTLEKIISELDTPKQRLIVVDNFETPWNGNQKQVGEILRKLAMLSHIAILVTMRGRRPPCYGAIKWQSKYIESTDEKACLRIYHEINPDSKNDRDVAKLLSALGHMPFAVTLMANLGAESRSSANLELKYCQTILNRAWIKVYGFLSRVTLSSGTPMLPSFSLSFRCYQQEQRMRICVGGLQQSSRRFPLPLPLCRRQDYCLRIDGKIRPFQFFSWFLLFSHLCSSKTGSHRRSGSRYICCAVNMY